MMTPQRFRHKSRHGPRWAGAVLWACLSWCGTVWAASASVPEGAPEGTASEVIVMLELDGEPLAENVVATERDGTLYLPICSIAQMLSLSLTCTGRQAYGFLLNEKRPFVIDLEEGLVISERNVMKVGDAAFVQGSDILVDIAQLSAWLPMRFTYNRERSTATVVPREELPVQAFRKRQKQYEAYAAPQPEKKQYDNFTAPRRLLSIPTIDFTTLYSLSAPPQRSLRHDYTTTWDLSGDVLYLSGLVHLWLEEGSLSRFDFSLSKRSESGFHIGWIPVTQLTLGTVPVVSVEGIGGGSSSLTGAYLSNRPLLAPAHFLSHEIAGYLPAGWDAELLHNGVPLAYQPPTSDGTYRFDNLRMQYGINSFKVILHGPFGELRETSQTFVSDAITPTGALLFTLAAGTRTGLTKSTSGLAEDDSNVTATADFGLLQHITGSAAFVRKVKRDGTRQSYAGFGMRSALGYNLVSLDLIQSFSSGRGAGQLLTMHCTSRDFWGVALQVDQRLFRDFDSDRFPALQDPVVSETVVKGWYSFPSFGGFRMPLTAALSIDAKRSGAVEGTSAVQLSGGWDGWNGSLGTDASVVQGKVLASSALQISTRVRGANVRGTAAFSLFPDTSPSAINVSAEKEVGDGYLVQSGVLHDPRNGVAELRAGITKRLGRMGYLLSASGATNGVYSVKAGINTSVAADPGNKQLVFSAEPLAPFGIIAVSATTAGTDGVVQEVPGLGFLVNGTRAITVAGSAGTRVIAFLEPDLPVDVTVDLTTIQDPFMVPLQDGCHITPRAGVVSPCHFTMVTGGEIDGMVLAELKEAGQVPLKGVTVNLLKGSGPGRHVVATAISQDSGYYLFKAVLPGKYQVAVPEAELKRLGSTGLGTVEVDMPVGGDQITGKDLVVTATAGRGHARRR